MTDADSNTPIEEWERLFNQQALTADIIRDFWKERVPRLAAECAVAGSADADPSACHEARRQTVLLQPLTELLFGDNVDQQQPAPATSGMCGKVFNNGDPTYSCRDCEQDPTCVLCADCFRQSAHQHHRYQMCVSLGMGGYCDCGDSEAWTRDPSCAAHQPAAETQPPPPAPPDLAGKATLLFTAAMQHTLSVFGRHPSTLNIVPLDLDLGREHYPARLARYAAIVYNHGVAAYDKVMETLVSATGCSQAEAKSAAASLRKEGVAVLCNSDYNGCDEVVKKLKRDQHRSLRCTEVHVVHVHVVAHQLFTLRLLRHLKLLLEMAPALRAVFSGVMAQTAAGSETPSSVLERLMASDPRQWKQARHECHLLLIQGMLMDIESKKFFAQVFTSRYQEQTIDSLPASVQEQSTIQDLSVQIYTVPSIAHHLVAEHNALAVVLGTLVDECSTYTHGGQLVLRDVKSRTDSLHRFERLLSCLTDARYLLSVAPDQPTELLRDGVRRGLDTLLQLLFFCEGMEPVVRAQTAHVLYDQPYELQLTVAVSLAPLITQVLQWCAADTPLLVHAYRSVLRKLESRLPPDKYFQRQPATLLGRSVLVSQCTVMTMPVSLELPLSRLFAGLHLQLAGHGLRHDSDQLAGASNVSPLGLLERPLRALIMDAQVRAGQWKRNGRSLEIMCSWYSLSMQVADMRDRDLQVAQICASLMDSDEFVATLMFRHGANLYVTPAADQALREEQDDDTREHIENGMAGLLLLLIHVFSERYHPGVGVVTKQECLENEVIRFLCVKPMTHSQLTKRLPEADSSLLETVVRHVADFATQEDHRGLRTYQLKPEFYWRYSCTWHHYSRRDGSMSEQLQRRRRAETAGTGPTCLPPPALPAFRAGLLPARRIFTCDTTLLTVLAVLRRLKDGEPSGISESILQRVLYLMAMALGEEERDPSGFCFSRPAHQCGIADLLISMVGSTRLGSQSELLGWVVDRLNQQLGRDAAPLATSADSAAASSEQKRRRAAAAARRARILDQMQAQQRRFLTQNATALTAADAAATAATAAPAAGPLIRSDSSMDLGEGGESDKWPVCVGPRQATRPAAAAAAEYTCILCQAVDRVLPTRPAMVMAAFVQRSTVLCRDRTFSTKDHDVPHVPTHLLGMPHTSSCGHAMHATCWRNHFDSVARERRRHPRVHYLSGFDVRRQEFLCPLCQRLSNTVVPIVPVAAAAAHPPTEDNFGVWLSALVAAADEKWEADEKLSGAQAAAGAGRQQCGRLMQHVTQDMSSHDADQFRAVMRLGDEPPRAHQSTLDIADQFIKSLHTATYAGVRRPPPQSPPHLRSQLLRSCVYSLHCAEQLLRHQVRALLAADGSRAHLCLTQLTQLGSTLLPTVTSAAAVADSTGALLRLLLRPPARPFNFVLVDALGLLVALSSGLTPLFVADGEPPSAPSGSLRDLHCVRFSLAVHLVQLLLTLDPAAVTGHEPMETEEPGDTGTDEQRWLAELNTLVRSAAGLQAADVSPLLLRQHIVIAVTPFLRCCALYFHLLTGVRAPAELQQPLSLSEQYPHLLRYLGLDSLRVPEATQERSLLRDCIYRWCSDKSLQDAAAMPLARRLVEDRLCSLVDLPHEYSDLIIRASSFRCECGDSETSSSPVLCLVCGVMLCSELACMRDGAEPRRGMDAHAVTCGDGVGLLLVVRRCKLFLLHSYGTVVRKVMYPPPYVDRFGEVDQGLRRGNPLTLQPQQYAKLTRLWLSHGVTDEVSRYLEEFSAGMILE